LNQLVEDVLKRAAGAIEEGCRGDLWDGGNE